jgi:acetyl-CoA C-acetyltransferase
MKNDAVIMDFVRTPLCPAGGALAKQSVEALAQNSLEALLNRTGVDPDLIEQVIFGHAHMDTFPYNVARYAWLLARMPDDVPCFTVHHCGASGLQAIQKAFFLARTGNDLISIAGGAESYSNAPYILRQARYKIDLKACPVADSIEEGELYTQPQPLDPRELARRLAQSRGFTRELQDSYVAADAGKATGSLWQNHISPVVWSDRKKGEIRIGADVLANCEAIAASKPFRADSTVTGGNFAHYADGAAAMLIMRGDQAERLGKKPVAKILAVASAACAADNRWEAAVRAVERLLDRNPDIPAGEIAVTELIADSAASMMAIADGINALGIKPDVINPNGSCLARGVNEGADGVISTGAGVLALRQNGGRYGIVAAGAAGGQGMALLIERM